jgi:phage shock protein PspC (stress-responsive transcriptional regulator)
MWTAAFWKATAERVVRGAAGGVATVMGLDYAADTGAQVTAESIAYAAAFGGLAGLVLSLIAIPVGSAPSPSFVPRAEADAALEPVRELVAREGIVVAHERLQRLDNHGAN